jgi:xanthine dehydrogenase accessory factor
VRWNHVAETLAALGRLMGFFVTVDDPGADRTTFPDADRLITDDLDLGGVAIGAQTCVVIATQHKGDHLWLQKALETEAPYIALISSRYRAALVLDYLAATGIPAAKLDRVWAPAGIDLGAQSPEEIALSIMSQIVALRRGGSAQALKQSAAESTVEPAEGKVISQCDVP